MHRFVRPDRTWRKSLQGNCWSLPRFAPRALVLAGFSLFFECETLVEASDVPPEAPQEAAGQLTLDRITRRLELRDISGKILTEILPGTIDRRVQEGMQAFRISFGRDATDRFSAVIRPMAGQNWLRIGVAGRDFILSPGTSLLATWETEHDLCRYEGSISGKVWMWQVGLGQGWLLMAPKDP